MSYSVYIKFTDLYIQEKNIEDQEEIEYYYQVWPMKSIIFSFNFRLGNFFYYPEYYNNVINFIKTLKNETQPQ
jgi:hypothetical protein